MGVFLYGKQFPALFLFLDLYDVLILIIPRRIRRRFLADRLLNGLRMLFNLHFCAGVAPVLSGFGFWFFGCWFWGGSYNFSKLLYFSFLYFSYAVKLMFARPYPLIFLPSLKFTSAIIRSE